MAQNSKSRTSMAKTPAQRKSTTKSLTPRARGKPVRKTHKDESARAETGRFFSPAGLGLHSRTIVIRNVQPCIDCGKFPVKRELGDSIEVTANVFREGHDKLAAVILFRRFDEEAWREAPFEVVNAGLDTWRGSFHPPWIGRYEFTIEAWADEFESWCSEAQKKLDADQQIPLELIEGRELLEEVLERAEGPDVTYLTNILKQMEALDESGRAGLLLSPQTRAAARRWPNRRTAVRHEPPLEVVVDREAARFAAWYEIFPRSQAGEPGRHGTFDDCINRLPDIRAMGFNVLYLVPIHPIGRAFRKGPNNTLNAGPNDPGSPYAIGSEEGGHKAIHPQLGTIEDFRRLVAACHDHGMEIALDFAIQCAPDHPWIKEHPEWFLFRPDGTIKYAENPPKKYQDIVNVDFFCEDWKSLWEELKSTFEYWAEQGCKIFRVDNPHTKPVPFWEWVIREVQTKYPDVIFLAEAFTRPEMMKMLAKVGFTQSYTYFTWRHSKEEFTEYLTELTQTEVNEYMRPNFFPNTPDINPPFLQTGGRPAHMIRFILASTLSTVYGIYSGFELCEATPIPGREEYLNSEKYEIRVWDWHRPGNIGDYISKVNWIRAENLALQQLKNLRFHESTDDNILFYGKMTEDRSNMIFIAVNLDPFTTHSAMIEFPLAEMGFGESETFRAEELLSGRRFDWQGASHFIELRPHDNPCEIFRVARP